MSTTREIPKKKSLNSSYLQNSGRLNIRNNLIQSSKDKSKLSFIIESEDFNKGVEDVEPCDERDGVVDEEIAVDNGLSALFCVGGLTASDDHDDEWMMLRI